MNWIDLNWRMHRFASNRLEKQLDLGRVFLEESYKNQITVGDLTAHFFLLLSITAKNIFTFTYKAVRSKVMLF